MESKHINHHIISSIIADQNLSVPIVGGDVAADPDILHKSLAFDIDDAQNSRSEETNPIYNAITFFSDSQEIPTPRMYLGIDQNIFGLWAQNLEGSEKLTGWIGYPVWELNPFFFTDVLKHDHPLYFPTNQMDYHQRHYFWTGMPAGYCNNTSSITDALEVYGYGPYDSNKSSDYNSKLTMDYVWHNWAHGNTSYEFGCEETKGRWVKKGTSSEDHSKAQTRVRISAGQAHDTLTHFIEALNTTDIVHHEHNTAPDVSKAYPSYFEDELVEHCPEIQVDATANNPYPAVNWHSYNCLLGMTLGNLHTQINGAGAALDRISTLEDQVSALEQTVQTLTNLVNSLSNDLSTVEHRVTTVEEDLYHDWLETDTPWTHPSLTSADTGITLVEKANTNMPNAPPWQKLGQLFPSGSMVHWFGSN
jgi:hypothetical protein